MAKAAGDPRRSWTLLAGLAALALARPFVGCGGGTDGTNPVAETLALVLADTWPHVVEPALARPLADAEALTAATGAWAAAERAGSGAEEARAAAQDAWRATMAGWQEIELLQLGPAGSSLTAVGGSDLRDQVYSWPTTNRCLVDQETARADYADPSFFAENLPNVRGLAALETVLFSPPGENACPPQVDINASGSWDALGADGVQRSRADYAAVLAADVEATLRDLRTAWDPSGGDFAGQLAAAGAADSPYESPDAALNAIFDALFYLETRTKDKKLGEPLGLRDCGSTSCLGVVETPLAGGSNEWITANLRGFRALFTASDGVGMEDLLRELGHDDLADRVLRAVDGADRAAAALDVPVDVAATTDPTAALELHAAVVAVTDLLKGEVATTLVLRIPSEAAGDVD